MPRSTAAEAAQTRSAIIQAGARQASVEGLEGLTIGRLADTLGLSKAGVIGPFGSKQELQLAVLTSATDLFAVKVWEPVAELPAGARRLRATAERWIEYLSDCPLPGGCFITTASTEWDARPGRVRDAVATHQRRWLRTLAADAEVAIRAGELPAEPGPEELAYTLNALMMGLNQAVQLFADPEAPVRARRAVDRLLVRKDQQKEG
jgi:AcrR family transcriptional regulator